MVFVPLALPIAYNVTQLELDIVMLENVLLDSLE